MPSTTFRVIRTSRSTAMGFAAAQAPFYRFGHCRIFASESGRFCEGTAFFCAGAKPPGSPKPAKSITEPGFGQNAKRCEARVGFRTAGLSRPARQVSVTRVARSAQLFVLVEILELFKLLIIEILVVEILFVFQVLVLLVIVVEGEPVVLEL